MAIKEMKDGKDKIRIHFPNTRFFQSCERLQDNAPCYDWDTIIGVK